MTKPPSTADAIAHGGPKAVGIGIALFIAWLLVAAVTTHLLGTVPGALAALGILAGFVWLVLTFADWDQVREDLEDGDEA